MNWILRQLYKVSWFIKRNIGYSRKGTVKSIDSITAPTNNKKIVYFIACHVNADHIIRMMKHIYHEDNLYYINLDLKTPIKFYKKIINHFANYPNVYINNTSVDWGRWSQVQVVLDIMKNALAIDKAWTHFINLSGQDFPLKKQVEIMTELEKQPGISYIEADYFPSNEEAAERLFSLRRWGQEYKNKPRLDLMYPELKFYKGSQWMILSRDICDYFVNGELPKKVQPTYKKVYIPDESFFPTMAANSEFLPKIIWNNRRFISWSGWRAHPETLKMEHLPQIDAGDFYFARKFDSEIDGEIIDELEKRLF